jgi:hypothetical protein
MKTDLVMFTRIKEAFSEGKIELDGFERDFLNSIEKRLDVEKDLTKRQREVLDQIQAKISPW